MCGGSSEINYWLLMANLANFDMFGKGHKMNYVQNTKTYSCKVLKYYGCKAFNN